MNDVSLLTAVVSFVLGLQYLLQDVTPMSPDLHSSCDGLVGVPLESTKPRRQTPQWANTTMGKPIG